jgi:hypothetical protein
VSTPTKAIAGAVQPAKLPTEILADDIRAVAEGVTKLLAGSLTERTLCLLIADASKGVSPKHVKAVLLGMSLLQSVHLKPVKS